MRRGALLIEMIIAIALFVGAGMVVSGSMRDGVRATIRAMDRERATDIAASAFALVEAGIGTVEEIDGPVPPYEDPDDTSNFADLLPAPTGWVIEAESDRSTFGSLTLLTVSVTREGEGGRPIAGSMSAEVDGLVHVARAVEDSELQETDLERELNALEGR